MRYIFYRGKDTNILDAPKDGVGLGARGILCHPSQTDFIVTNGFGFENDWFLSVPQGADLERDKPDELLERMRNDGRNSLIGGWRKTSHAQIGCLFLSSSPLSFLILRKMLIHPAFSGGVTFIVGGSLDGTPNLVTFISFIYDMLLFNSPKNPLGNGAYLSYLGLNSQSAFMQKRERARMAMCAWSKYDLEDEVKREGYRYYFRDEIKNRLKGNCKDEFLVKKAIYDTTRRFAIYVRKVWLWRLFPGYEPARFDPMEFFKDEIIAKAFSCYIENLNTAVDNSEEYGIVL